MNLLASLRDAAKPAPGRGGEPPAPNALPDLPASCECLLSCRTCRSSRTSDIRRHGQVSSVNSSAASSSGCSRSISWRGASDVVCRVATRVSRGVRTRVRRQLSYVNALTKCLQGGCVECRTPRQRIGRIGARDWFPSRQYIMAAVRRRRRSAPLRSPLGAASRPQGSRAPPARKASDVRLPAVRCALVSDFHHIVCGDQGRAHQSRGSPMPEVHLALAHHMLPIRVFRHSGGLVRATAAR